MTQAYGVKPYDLRALADVIEGLNAEDVYGVYVEEDNGRIVAEVGYTIETADVTEDDWKVAEIMLQSASQVEPTVVVRDGVIQGRTR